MAMTRRALLAALPLLTCVAAHAQGSPPRRFRYATGVFENVGPNAWLERTQTHTFQFTQQGGVVGGYVYLVDFSRVRDGDSGRPFHVRLPVVGGMAQWSFPNPFQWQDLAVVAPER